MPEPVSPVAYVCFQCPLPSRTQLAALADKVLGQVIETRGGQAPGLLAYQSPQGLVSVLLMPFPFPPGDLKDDLAQRAAWPDWKKEAATWKSHVIVTLTGAPNSFEARKAGVQTVLGAAAALAGHAGASAVGWSGSLLFHGAASAVQLLKAAPIPPGIVVRTLWRHSAMGSNIPEARTQGLRLFGLPEIEHTATGEEVTTLYNRILNLATYLIQRGDVIADGSTVGNEATPNMRASRVAGSDGVTYLSIKRITQ